jgi:pullulanase/glycogen debranching enzyme
MQLRHGLSDVIKDDFLNGDVVEWFAGDGNPLDWSKDNNRIIAMVLRAPTRRVCVFFNGTSTATTLHVTPETGKLWQNLTGEDLDAPAQSVMVFEEVSRDENPKTRNLLQ